MSEISNVREMSLLNELVSIQIKKMVDSGKLHEKISQVVCSTAENAITQQLSSYSDFGKAIDNSVKKALNYSVHETDFNSFSAMIVNQARAAINQYYETKAGEIMLEHVERLLKPLNITEIKLSEIIGRYKDYCRYDDLVKVNFYLEQSDTKCLDGYYRLYLDKKEIKNHERYRCEYIIGFNKSGIYSVSSGGSKEIHKEKLKLSNEFEGFLFQLCAIQVPIIIDEIEAEEACYFERDYDEED